jgi:hypothetical protein
MSTRARHAVAGAVLVIASALAPQAAAQTYAASAGWGAGLMSYQPFVEQGEHTPLEIGLSAPWVLVLTAESWQLDGWLGLRLGGSFSHGTVAFPTTERNVSAWGLEGAALVRVIPPAVDRAVSAYGMVGGGFIWFGLGHGGVVPIAATGVVYDSRERRQPMALLGGGIEFMTGMRLLDDQIGVRVEAADQVTFGSPFRPVEGASTTGSKHNLRLSVMLFSAVPGLF